MKGDVGIATATAADSTLGVETIREFRVVTNSFSADYGRAMGGLINIILSGVIAGPDGIFRGRRRPLPAP